MAEEDLLAALIKADWAGAEEAQGAEVAISG